LGFFGFFNVYAMRVCLSIAIEPMKTQFGWNATQEGFILSSFFVGYIVTQVPGGWLASRFGAKWVLSIGILWTAVLTLVTPFAARGSIYLLIALRVMEGVGEGVSYPAMHAMLSRWVPPLERSRLSNLCYSGAYVGTILGFPVSSALASSSFLGGWPAVFYLFGIIGILWFILWIPFVSNSPQEDPTISKEEREYIENSLQISSTEKLNVPWRNIFTNIHVWALVVNHTCNNWTFYTLLTWLPAYILHILNFDLAKSGFISVLPYIGLTVANIGGGVIADYMIAHWFSTTTVRKIFQCASFGLAGVCLAIIGHIQSVTLAVVVLTAAMTFVGLGGSGFGSNHLDIGAQYAGILMGISNTAATIPGIVSPILTGFILGEHPTVQNWQEVFYISSGVFGFGIIVWLLFASGKRQF